MGGAKLTPLKPRRTLFLDEIANVPLNLQAKLLRVLETGEMERVGSSKTRCVEVRVCACREQLAASKMVTPCVKL